MDGIVLDRAEFLVLLDALKVGAVIGIDSEELIPATQDEMREQVVRGLELLQQRGLLTVTADGVNALEPTLVRIAQAVLRPIVAFITARDNPGQGSQLFLHYIDTSLLVEQTFPAEGKHRLAIVPGLPALLERIGDILPLGNGAGPSLGGGASGVIAEAAFFEAKGLAEQLSTREAVSLLQEAGLGAAAHDLVAAMQRPVFSGTVAVLRCQDQEIVDARNVAVLQGEQTAWIFQQATPGETPLRITQADQSLLLEAVAQDFEQLAPVQA